MNLRDIVQLTLDYYQAHRAESSQQTYRSHADQIVDYFGPETKFQSLTRAEIQDWVDDRADDGLAASSIAHECAFLAKAYKLARRHGIEITSPLPSVDKPTVDNSRCRLPSPEEWALIQQSMDPWNFTLPEFSKQTMMRRAEIMALTVRDIKLAEAIKVPHPETGKPTVLFVGVAHIRTSKTGKSRDCPLNYTAAGIAHQWIHKEDRNGAGHLFVPHLNPENRIAAGKDWADRYWFALLKRLGIEDLHWHDIRHLGATLAFLNGAELSDISKMLGHKTIKQTERYINVVHLRQMWPAAIAVGKGFPQSSSIPPALAAYAPLLAKSGVIL